MKRTIRIGMLLMCLGFIGVGAVLADTVVPPNTTYSGNLSGSNQVWFAVPVTADGNLSVTLTPSDGVNIALAINTPEKTLIVSNDSWGQPTTLSVNGVKPDTFYISLYGYFAADQSHGFTLTTVFTAATLENDSEPNDSTTYAKTLSLNGTATGHIGYDGRQSSNPADEFDWWQITTVEDGSLTVSITQVNTVNLQLALYRPDGTSVIEGVDTWGNPTSLTINNLRNGTLFIRIFKYASNFTPYTLSNTFTPAPGSNDPEPNDSTGVASALVKSVQSRGHLGYNGLRDNYGVDTVDWWHFTLADTSALFIRLTQTASANLTMQLYKSDGTLVHGGSDTWGHGYDMSIDNALPGKYYLRVSTYGGFDSYALVFSDSEQTYVTDNDQTQTVPARFELFQNYPNPFNPVTTIQYELTGNDTRVNVSIFDVRGALVRTLINEVQNPGIHATSWDGKDNYGNTVSSGLYVYRLKVGNYSVARNMLLLR